MVVWGKGKCYDLHDKLIIPLWIETCWVTLTYSVALSHLGANILGLVETVTETSHKPSRLPLMQLSRSVTTKLRNQIWIPDKNSSLRTRTSIPNSFLTNEQCESNLSKGSGESYSHNPQIKWPPWNKNPRSLSASLNSKGWLFGQHVLDSNTVRLADWSIKTLTAQSAFDLRKTPCEIPTKP